MYLDFLDKPLFWGLLTDYNGYLFWFHFYFASFISGKIASSSFRISTPALLLANICCSTALKICLKIKLTCQIFYPDIWVARVMPNSVSNSSIRPKMKINASLREIVSKAWYCLHPTKRSFIFKAIFPVYMKSMDLNGQTLVITSFWKRYEIQCQWRSINVLITSSSLSRRTRSSYGGIHVL